MFVMEKKVLNHHASTVLVKCNETKEFLFGKYDSGYPGKNKHWIGRVKFIGGNYFCGRDNDSSPKETILREIEEEFSGKKAIEGMASSQEHFFASQNDIKIVREALLNLEPLQDYFLHQPGLKPIEYAIQSVYLVSFSKRVMEIVKKNINEGKSLTNEGNLAVHNLEEIISGNLLTHGITGLVIGHTEKIIPRHCFEDSFTFAPLNKPRETYSMYLDDFEYVVHQKK